MQKVSPVTGCSTCIPYWISMLQWRTLEFCSLGGGGGVCSTNSVEDRRQRGRGSGGGSLLVSGSAQFASE
jgi:hypothetical protein